MAAQPKPKKTPGNGRVQFTLADMIRALQGFRSPEGYTVMPNDIADRMLEEIERLYAIEDAIIDVLSDVSPPLEHPAVQALLDLIGDLNDNKTEARP